MFLTTKQRPRLPLTVGVFWYSNHSIPIYPCTVLQQIYHPVSPPPITRQSASSKALFKDTPTHSRTQPTTPLPSKWTTLHLSRYHRPPPAPNFLRIMTTRRAAGGNALKRIEELRLLNKKKNDETRKRQEEEEKRTKDKEEAARLLLIEVEAEKESGKMTSRALLDTLYGVEVVDEAAREIDTDERSPLKKRTGSSKSSSRRYRAQVTPPETNTIPLSTLSAKATTFLDDISHKYSRTVLELAILLKSDKAFEEFTQALMSFVSNAQMVDPKFVINPINEYSKEKNITSKGEISSNMKKLGLHVKISGYGNVFTKKKIWTNQDNERKSRKSKKEEFHNPTVYFSMVISSEVRPQEIVDRVTHEWTRLNGTHLQIKELQSIKSETVVTFFKVSTLTPKGTLLAELKKILLEAQQKAS
jgi:hypothetical protein